MTTMTGKARNAYLAQSVLTASPERLLLMLLDRLVLDTEQGLRAQMRGDRTEVNTQLQHAQRIVTELITSLDLDGMPAGQELVALYQYLNRKLIDANVRNDQSAGREAVQLSRRLRDMWHRAAAIAAAEAGGQHSGQPQVAR